MFGAMYFESEDQTESLSINLWEMYTVTNVTDVKLDLVGNWVRILLKLKIKN